MLGKPGADMEKRRDYLVASSIVLESQLGVPECTATGNIIVLVHSGCLCRFHDGYKILCSISTWSFA